MWRPGHFRQSEFLDKLGGWQRITILYLAMFNMHSQVLGVGLCR